MGALINKSAPKLVMVRSADSSATMDSPFAECRIAIGIDTVNVQFGTLRKRLPHRDEGPVKANDCPDT